MKKTLGYALLLLSLHFGISNLYAATENTSELIHQTQDGITYVYGGVGEEQRREIKELRKDFNLQLTFAGKNSGEFLADVHLGISDKSGKEILKLSNVGPILLIKLDPGKYHIKATSGGDNTQTKIVTINKKGLKDLYFYW